MEKSIKFKLARCPLQHSAAVTLISVPSQAPTEVVSALPTSRASGSDPLVSALALVCHVDETGATRSVLWVECLYTDFPFITLCQPVIRMPITPPQTYEQRSLVASAQKARFFGGGVHPSFRLQHTDKKTHAKQSLGACRQFAREPSISTARV